jgi:hypothetical protein
MVGWGIVGNILFSIAGHDVAIFVIVPAVIAVVAFFASSGASLDIVRRDERRRT